MKQLRVRFIEHLTHELGAENIRVNSPTDMKQCLPNMASVGINNVHSGELLRRIGDRMAVSAGLACHLSGGKVSAVLLAMKVPMNFSNGTLHLSVGVGTTESHIDAASKIIVKEVRLQWECEAQ